MSMTGPARMSGGRTGGDGEAPLRECTGVRFLSADDVESLVTLEEGKWDEDQAASAAELAARIQAYPQLCVGAFTADGVALASLFMKPITVGELRASATWSDCAEVRTSDQAGTRSLFGISLSSIDATAVMAIFEFFWPYALKSGWRDIYLGSPMPGLRGWKMSNPEGSPTSYMREKRHGMPRDPQLRYYYNKGFREILECKPGYFPHPASLDHGALLRGRIPLAAGAPLWRLVPLPWLQLMRKTLFRLV